MKTKIMRIIILQPEISNTETQNIIVRGIDRLDNTLYECSKNAVMILQPHELVESMDKIILDENQMIIMVAQKGYLPTYEKEPKEGNIRIAHKKCIELETDENTELSIYIYATIKRESREQYFNALMESTLATWARGILADLSLNKAAA